jgi:hypothetical protein
MAILQGGLLNTSKKEGGLSESSRSSTGGLWLSGVMFLPCLPTDTQHLFYSHRRSIHDRRLQLFSNIIFSFLQLFSPYCA